MEMGERIAWGSDTALMREAADRIEALEDAIKETIEENLDLADGEKLHANQAKASYQLRRFVAAYRRRNCISTVVRLTHNPKLNGRGFVY